MRTTSGTRFFGCSVILLLPTVSISACYVCAPPVRSANNSAPAKLEAGEMEVETAIVVLDDPGPGIHAGAAYAISDHIAVEAGSDSIVENSSMGYAGLRIVPAPVTEQERRVKFLFDIVLGGGVGVGGRREYESDDDGGFYPDPSPSGQNDGVDWKDRLAGGGYFSMGMGFNVGIFDLFGRFGWQVTKAQNIPTTHIFSGILAPQFTIRSLVKLHFGPGMFGYYNEVESGTWFYLEGGLGVVFDLMSG